MMKKTIGLMLICVLLVAMATGCSAGNNSDSSEEASRYFEDPTTGLKFLWPAPFYEALYEEPCLSPYGGEYGFGFDYVTSEGRELQAKLPNKPGNEYTEEEKEIFTKMEEQIIPLCAFLVEKGDKKDKEMRERYSDEKVLGTKNGTKYTLLTNSKADIAGLPKEDQDKFKKLIAATDEFEKEITLSGMKEIEGAVAFNSKTMNDKQIDSSVFKDHKLTMINIWATWCGPCVEELPELEKLHKKLPKGVNMLGICTDGKDESETAKAILKKAGVKYENIAANKEMLEGFLANIQSYPTTIFVDSEGNMVGEPFAGAPSGDIVKTYTDTINERLDMLEK